MKKIDEYSDIFYSDDFKEDKYKFYTILQNFHHPNLELYSDEKNYVVCKAYDDKPIWIWTKDNFDRWKLKEVEKVIEMFLESGVKTRIICKKEFYDLLNEKNYVNLNQDDYFEMAFLYCKNPIMPNKTDGKLYFPTINDRDVLVKYWFDDNEEASEASGITMEEAARDVEAFISSGSFYVFKNQEGKIVSMAGYSTVDKLAKITHVYTPIDERNKGYATDMIYQITNELIYNGYRPLLYTNYHNPASNKAYMKAGYEMDGILVNVSCSKNK